MGTRGALWGRSAGRKAIRRRGRRRSTIGRGRGDFGFSEGPDPRASRRALPGARGRRAEAPRARAMSDSSESDASPPTPPRRRGARARDVPFSEMTIVEKQVAMMMRQRDEEDAERHRLGQRAEALRKDGEAALIALGDLDEDSDSEAEDDDVAGAMGRARRDARRLGTLVRITAPGSNPAPPRSRSPRAGRRHRPRDDPRGARHGVRVDAARPASVRGRDEVLGQRVRGHPIRVRGARPPGPPDAPGRPRRRASAARRRRVPPRPRPRARRLRPPQGRRPHRRRHGVRQGLRRLGIGAAVARRFIDRARAAAVTRAGPPTYDVDAMPAAVAFWTALGFERAKTGADSPTTKVMRRLCGDVAMTLELVADPPEPEGGEWWAPKSARGGGGEKDAARRMGWSSDDD